MDHELRSVPISADSATKETLPKQPTPAQEKDAAQRSVLPQEAMETVDGIIAMLNNPEDQAATENSINAFAVFLEKHYASYEEELKPAVHKLDIALMERMQRESEKDRIRKMMLTINSAVLGSVEKRDGVAA